MSDDPKPTASPDSPEEMSRRQFLRQDGRGFGRSCSARARRPSDISTCRRMCFTNRRRSSMPGKPDHYAPDSVTLDPQTAIYVVRTAEGFFALSAICTHLGCLTAYKPDLGIIACPCHGSKFNKDGVKIEGPAPRPLPWLRMWLSDDGNLHGRPLQRHRHQATGEGLTMANTIDQLVEQVRENRIWRSIFRSGTR